MRSATTTLFSTLVGFFLSSSSTLLLVEAANHSAFECNICGPGFEIGDLQGIIALPGRENRTCAELQTFGTDGLILADQCTELAPIVQEPCECRLFVCELCPGGISTNPGGVIDVPGDDEGLTTCAAVLTAAQAGAFNETICPSIQNLTALPCGCTTPSTPTRAPVPIPTRAPVAAPPTEPPTAMASGRMTMTTAAMGVSTTCLLLMMIMM